MINIFSSKTFLMGTQVEIKIVGDYSQVDSENILRETLNIFYKVVAKLSRFEESSELSILNLHSGEANVVSKELYELIKLGKELGELTGGVFDITIGDILEKYGYKKEIDIVEINDEEMDNLVRERLNFKDIEFIENSSEIKTPKGLKIDLGSFGKGYAIKLAKEFLLSKHVTNFLINAGGDVYANGLNQKGVLWKTLLFRPEDPYNSKIIDVENTSIASSGYWGRKYKKFNHLIDPKSGRPNFSETVFVECQDPMIADLMATITYLNPPNIEGFITRFECKKIE